MGETWRALGPSGTCGVRRPYLIVMVGAAHVRAAPTLQAPILMTEPYGTRLALHSTRGAWAEVEAPTGRTGWTLRALLRSS